MWSGTRDGSGADDAEGKEPISVTGQGTSTPTLGSIFGVSHDAGFHGKEDDGGAGWRPLENQRPCCPPDTQEVTPAKIRLRRQPSSPGLGGDDHGSSRGRGTVAIYTVIECAVRPGGGGADAHVHPNESETFEVLKAELSLRSAATSSSRSKETWSRTAREGAKSPERHRPESVRFRSPSDALVGFEEFLQTICALGADGKLNKRGMPRPLQLAVIATRPSATRARRMSPPGCRKRPSSVGSAIGRLAGYGPSYEPAPSARLRPQRSESPPRRNARRSPLPRRATPSVA